MRKKRTIRTNKFCTLQKILTKNLSSSLRAQSTKPINLDVNYIILKNINISLIKPQTYKTLYYLPNMANSH